MDTPDEVPTRGGTVPDLLGPDVRLLFVGVNPGLSAMATRTPFGRRGNRFYPALHLAGITDHRIDASEGFDPADVEHLLAQGVGITRLVARATGSAAELGAGELVSGAAALAGRVAEIGPAAVAILGVTAYRTAFGRPGAVVGRQPDDLAGVPVWVVPNPSGRNAHASVADLAAAYREVAVAAGIDVRPPPLR